VIAANDARGGKIVLRPGKHYVLTRRGAGEDAGLTGDLDVSLGVEPFDVSLGIEVETKGQRRPMATIDANGIDRVFDGSPTLDRVILRGGHARAIAGDHGNGGAVRGYPTVTDSRFIKNTADARGGTIYFSRGPSAISRTTLKGNNAAGDGGAVYFLQACNGPENHFDFTKSRAMHNSAGGNGGAIFSHCGLALNGGSAGSIFLSTVSGNSTRLAPGGMGGGTGLNAPTAGSPVSLAVENSTIANNSAGADGGGIGSNDPGASFGNFAGSNATVTLDHVTIARNRADTEHMGEEGRRSGTGGGIYIEGNALIGGNDRASVHNTILALDTVATFRTPQPSDCAVGFGATGTTFQSLGYNLIGNPTGCNGFGAVGDLFAGKLRLGKLADNGGRPKTIALQTGSRAINHADRTARGDDQRGFRRDKKPDIGAFERGAKKK
jgi:hypothetical protein